MEGQRRVKFLLMCFLFALLVSPSLVTLVKCRSLEEFADQKSYYSPDPYVGSPPPHIVSPPEHSHKSPSCSPPPPSVPGCTPSHGSCGGYGTPPAPPHGGSSGTSTPPSHGGGSGGSGGYYNSPPTIPPPSPDVVPVTPTPTTPLIPPTPTTPFPPTPSTPIISTPPSPPFIPDPNNPPFIPGTYYYWSTNPVAIWGIFGYWATIGQLFGPVTTFPFGRNLSVQEALANTRRDGIGALYREGTAAFLNSLVNRKFPFTTQQVRHAFTSALASEKVAAAQARLFKLANEGHLKKH